MSHVYILISVITHRKGAKKKRIKVIIYIYYRYSFGFMRWKSEVGLHHSKIQHQKSSNESYHTPWSTATVVKVIIHISIQSIVGVFLNKNFDFLIYIAGSTKLLAISWKIRATSSSLPRKLQGMCLDLSSLTSSASSMRLPRKHT